MLTQNEQTAGLLTVQIVTYGRDTRTVALPVGSTVADAFREASISIAGKDVYCGSTKAEPHFQVENGDVLTTIESKVDAGVK